MYIPEHFEETRSDEVARIIEAFPLATMVTETSDGLTANHIPLLRSHSEGDEIRLTGHVARNNPVHREAVEDRDVLVVFKADDAYISPNWYPSKAEHHKHVPTWNYQAVHCTGRLRFIDDPKILRGIVGNLTKRFETETNGINAWRMSDAPRDFMDEMLASIIGVEIEVSQVVAKSKLSQNREPADYDSVRQHLERLGSTGIAGAMP